jgi:hypothetical protein
MLPRGNRNWQLIYPNRVITILDAANKRSLQFCQKMERKLAKICPNFYNISQFSEQLLAKLTLFIFLATMLYKQLRNILELHEGNF